MTLRLASHRSASVSLRILVSLACLTNLARFADKIYHPLGEFNAAKVAGELNLAYALSTAGSQPISEVARVNDEGFSRAGRSRAHGAEKGRFFQLYWPPNDEFTISLLRDAHENGYSACILTLDTWQLAWRHGDISAANYAFYVRADCPDRRGGSLLTSPSCSAVSGTISRKPTRSSSACAARKASPTSTRQRRDSTGSTWFGTRRLGRLFRLLI